VLPSRIRAACAAGPAEIPIGGILLVNVRQSAVDMQMNQPSQ